MIAKSDEMHYNAMAHMSEGLKRAQDAGTKIAIIANTEHDIGTSTGVNSDYIIDVHSASGAYCAPFGEKFPADYKKQNTVCNDPTHWHISPERDIDASCAYLPENTWFIKDMLHCKIHDERTLCQIRQVPVGLPHIERHRADYREPLGAVRHRDNQRQGGRHGCRPFSEERNRS